MVRRPLVIVGAGGHGRVALDAARLSGCTVLGFLDDTLAPGGMIDGARILGGTGLTAALAVEADLFIALGDQAARRAFALSVLGAGGTLATLVHPAAVVSPAATVGDGSILAAGAILQPGARVGRFCILNTACSVDHDGVLLDGVQVGPGVRLAGRVCCGEDAFLGTGAIVLPGLSIGRGAVVGAGAVVVGDVPADITVVGNPARPLRR
ncbi:NeuD/PglB/VioB family sugar acetyltransferase [Rhodospirillum centenum]|uniref:Hexapeptide transferase family protein n=1 Tax=Rhodospirillum centenum (strain ATCC 51521 / SW) TaxID=414684 RepID=B6IS26_RHOCS|nr:NeuD/PglB/VioB family sugar acetyltransferase [Rhodospirillum centenum]ACI98262.1 hexapeptide transferase family protein [Rhodospirillum centenum SW]